MSIWKQLFVLCLLAVASYGGYEAYVKHYRESETTAEKKRDHAISVETAIAEIRLLKQTVEAVGTTRAWQSVEIVPETDGRLIWVHIKPGAQVAAGEVLARLDETIEQADLDEARARLTAQTQALARIEHLSQTNAVSQANLEEAVAKLAEARAQLDRAKQRLADRTIRAPFAGIVGLADIDQGARVNATDMITRLDDLSKVVVEFWLPETLYARIVEGQSIVATSAAFPNRNFEGNIAEIDNRIDPISRAFRARAVVPNPDRTLPAGMFMSLTLTLEQTNALIVPEEAIVFQAAETYVFVVEDGVATRRPVATGKRKDGVVSVTSGIKDGDVVIIRGLQSVRDGKQVKITGEKSDTVSNADSADGDT